MNAVAADAASPSGHVRVGVTLQANQQGERERERERDLERERERDHSSKSSSSNNNSGSNRNSGNNTKHAVSDCTPGIIPSASSGLRLRSQKDLGKGPSAEIPENALGK